MTPMDKVDIALRLWGLVSVVCFGAAYLSYLKYRWRHK